MCNLGIKEKRRKKKKERRKREGKEEKREREERREGKEIMANFMNLLLCQCENYLGNFVLCFVFFFFFS